MYRNTNTFYRHNPYFLLLKIWSFENSQCNACHVCGLVLHCTNVQFYSILFSKR